jgi:PAS domain S-box-containing protein
MDWFLTLYFRTTMNTRPPQLSWKQLGSTFLNTTQNAILVTDCCFKTLISNQKARDHLGIFKGELVKNILPELAKHSESVIKNTTSVGDIPLIRHSKNFIADISPILQNQTIVGLFFLVRDVTLLENTTREMKACQKSSLELDTIINSSHDGFWISDGQGKVRKINPASEKLTGIKAEKFIGKSIQELLDTEIIDRSVTLKVMETRKKETIIQRTKTGKNLLLTGTPVFDKDGQLIRVVVNERDITEIQALKKEIDEKQTLKTRLEEDLLDMQLEALQSKKIIAKSQNFKTTLEKAAKIARVDSSVLILGESGTGKGVIAELIHYHSKRRDKPMIKLNCGNIPESLVESELFGYKKGAFTGADKNKAGRFEIADKGILFLDEIAEVPLASQVKLLRFLEDGCLSRVGETTSKRVNVRIIAATNQNLEAMVADKTFRQDLYYRLKVIPILLPPLRNRKACILPLISHYLNYFCEKHGIEGPIILSRNAANTLETYAYPGNIRELINLCERLVVMKEGNKIHSKDLPQSLMDSAKYETLFKEVQTQELSHREMMETFERQILKNVMETHLTQSKAARALGLNQSTIARKLQKYKLE